MSPGVGRKDVQNQFRAVDDFRAQRLFEISRLGRRQIVVEQNHIGPSVLDKIRQLLDLASTQIGRLVGMLALLENRSANFDPSRLG